MLRHSEGTATLTTSETWPVSVPVSSTALTALSALVNSRATTSCASAGGPLRAERSAGRLRRRRSPRSRSPGRLRWPQWPLTGVETSLGGRIVWTNHRRTPKSCVNTSGALIADKGKLGRRPMESSAKAIPSILQRRFRHSSRSASSSNGVRVASPSNGTLTYDGSVGMSGQIDVAVAVFQFR